MLIVRRPVIGFYRLVTIGDFKSTTSPDWDESAEERGVTVSDDMLIVSTSEYTVIVDVYSEEPKLCKGELVFDGSLNIHSSVLSIGNVVSENETLILPHSGAWKIKIFVRPKVDAQHVTVFLPEFADPDFSDVDDLDPLTSE